MKLQKWNFFDISFQQDFITSFFDLYNFHKVKDIETILYGCCEELILKGFKVFNRKIVSLLLHYSKKKSLSLISRRQHWDW